MAKQYLLKVGDVIESGKNWYMEKGGGVDTNKHGFERRTKIPEKLLFVVEETYFGGGGGTGMNRHDTFPDGHQVHARQLTKNGKYKPKGTKIYFYQTGCFTCMIESPKVVGKMTKKLKFK